MLRSSAWGSSDDRRAGEMRKFFEARILIGLVLSYIGGTRRIGYRYEGGVKVTKNIKPVYPTILCLCFISVFIVEIEIQAMTPEEAMERIVEAYHKHMKQTKQKPQRRISFSMNDWPVDVKEFIQVKRANMPILGEPTFTGTTLTIMGLTKQEEILQFLDHTHVGGDIILYDPLGPGPISNGVWVKVGFLDGREGWILAVPHHPRRDRYFAVSLKRVSPQPEPVNQPNQDLSNESIALIVIILGITVTIYSINSMKEKGVKEKRVYRSDTKMIPQQEFHTRLTRLQNVFPDLPPLPVHPINYEGWFMDVKKRVEIRSQQRTAQERLKLMKQVNDLQAEWLKFAQITHELNRFSAKVAVDDQKIQKEKEELELEKRKIELEKEKIDRELKRIDLEEKVKEMELEAKLAELEQKKKEMQKKPEPPKPPEQPKVETVEEYSKKIDQDTEKKKIKARQIEILHRTAEQKFRIWRRDFCSDIRSEPEGSKVRWEREGDWLEDIKKALGEEVDDAIERYEDYKDRVYEELGLNKTKR